MSIEYSSKITAFDINNNLDNKSDINHTHSDYLPTSGGTMSGDIAIESTLGIGIKWNERGNKGKEVNPFMGYCSNSSDGTFVVGSLTGTTYQTGLAIGGTSGNLLWKGAKILDSNNYSEFANKYTLPNATSSVLGGVKVGSNITVTSGTISITNDNVTSALGFTPLSSSGVLSVANGGTGSSTKNFVDLSSAQTIAGNKTFNGTIISKTQHANVVALTGSEINLSQGTCFIKTITADTTFSITGVTSGKSACFTLILTNGGSAVISFPTYIKWSDSNLPELTVSGVDVLTFITMDGGTTWYGSPSIINAL